jgi:protein gp37
MESAAWVFARQRRMPELLRGTAGRVGKKVAGRLLDGREWNEFPVVNR